MVNSFSYLVHIVHLTIRVDHFEIGIAGKIRGMQKLQF